MHKTTVYLPDDLKEALTRAAEEAGQSEAELIREGVRLVIEKTAPPPPRAGIFDSGDPQIASKVDALLAEGFGRK